MSESNNNLPDWFNGIFIINLITIVGGGCGYLLIFILKSRCTRIETCCLSCDRDVLPPNSNVSLTQTRNNPTGTTNNNVELPSYIT